MNPGRGGNFSCIPRIPGIYAIRNMRNNRIYIGGSENVFKRIETQRLRLRKPTECTLKIREDLEMFGLNAFEIYILEYCDSEKVSERENYYMQKLDTLNTPHGYNCQTAKHNDYINRRGIGQANKYKGDT